MADGKTDFNYSFYFGKKVVSFDDLQWGARFIRGNMIEIGPLQYELIYQIPKYLEDYYSKRLIKIHVPPSKKLNIDAVNHSLEIVDSMLERYDWGITSQEILYYTDSWLLSPELLQFLDDHSHIIQFQKKFQLVGLVDGKAAFLKFVIHNEARHNTLLQRKIQLYLEKGIPLHSGIGILTRDQKSNRRI